MPVNLAETIRCLSVGAEAIRAMTYTIPPAQAAWKPDAETWSLLEVMDHLYNEERIDFRKHLRELLSDPPSPWGEFDPAGLVQVESLAQGLEGFLAEREASLAWLRTLEAADWETRTATPWGREISAGDVLVSWVDHDYLHLRQLNELLHAWNVHTAAPYSVRYAGEW
jgi:hypothetical protein